MVSYDEVFGPVLEELLETAAERFIESALDDARQELIKCDGGIYYGERKRGIPNGQGKLVVKDGAFFEGTFVNGKMTDGYVEYAKPNGQSWSGNYKNGNIAAPGQFTLPDGSIWEGIRGEFIDEGSGAVFTGVGRIVQADGTIYEGEMTAWHPNGEGKMTVADGTVREGTFKDGRQHGKGKIKFADGTVYEGDISDWQPNEKLINEDDKSMSRISTKEGIVIEAKGDTLYFSNIPNDNKYSWGLFSLKRPWVEGGFPPGVFKRVENGQTSYCFRDRGEGQHKVFISFCPEKANQPEYTQQHGYHLNIAENGTVNFSE